MESMNDHGINKETWKQGRPIIFINEQCTNVKLCALIENSQPLLQKVYVKTTIQ